VNEALVTDEISIGDYVLSGGEPAAVVLVDAMVRLLPDALGSETSAENDSFSNVCSIARIHSAGGVRGMRFPMCF
jgi:tRNA (guanine37-N1)-methyltransferase